MLVGIGGSNKPLRDIADLKIDSDSFQTTWGDSEPASSEAFQRVSHRSSLNHQQKIASGHEIADKNHLTILTITPSQPLDGSPQAASRGQTLES